MIALQYRVSTVRVVLLYYHNTRIVLCTVYSTRYYCTRAGCGCGYQELLAMAWQHQQRRSAIIISAIASSLSRSGIEYSQSSHFTASQSQSNARQRISTRYSTTVV